MGHSCNTLATTLLQRFYTLASHLHPSSTLDTTTTTPPPPPLRAPTLHHRSPTIHWQADLVTAGVDALMLHTTAPTAAPTGDGDTEPALDVYKVERPLPASLRREGDHDLQRGDVVVCLGDAPGRNIESAQWRLGYKAKDPKREVKLFRVGPGGCVQKLGSGDVARLTASTVVGLTAVDTSVIGEPTEMMLCNADGSDKHNRWFWIDAETRTLKWAKKKNGKRKKQQQLTGCAADASNKLTFAGTDGESKFTRDPPVACGF